jgi:hypothetical protein
MGIVAASMHDSRDLAPIGSVSGFLDREGVDVRTQAHDTARPAATEDGRDAGLRHGVAHLEAEVAETLGHERARMLLSVAELGVGVEMATSGDDLGGDLLRGRLDLRVGNGAGGQEQAKGQDHQCLLVRAPSYVRCDGGPVKRQRTFVDY